MARPTPFRAPRARTPAVLTAVAATAVAMLGSSAHATPAPRPLTPHPRMVAATNPDFVSASATVVTSSGKKLALTVGGSRGASNSRATVKLGLPSGVESHDWMFAQLPRSAVQIDTTGRGTMSVTLPNSFGSLKLTVTPHGDTTTDTACATKTRGVTVSGRVVFDTKSSGTRKWGKLDKSPAFGTAGYVSWSTGTPTDACYVGLQPPCPSTTGFTWSSDLSRVAVSGTVTPTRARIAFVRNSTVSSTAAINRFDTMTATLVKHPTLSTSGTLEATGKLTIDATGSTRVEGTAKITGTKSERSDPCGNDGHSLNTTTWTGSYTPGSTPLTGQPQIFAAMRPAAAPQATVNRYSLSVG